VPRRAAVDAFHSNVPLSGSPLVETRFVHVVATCCFTPHKLIMLFVEVHVADWTFAFHRFPLAVRVFGTRNVRGYSWCCRENVSQLRGQKCKLTLKMLRCPKNVMQDIDFVFTFISFLVIRARARSDLPDRYLHQVVRSGEAVQKPRSVLELKRLPYRCYLSTQQAQCPLWGRPPCQNACVSEQSSLPI
jgi:hypothetical protein